MCQSIIFHLIHPVLYQGSPSLYATWKDEALNKMLKAACRQLSQQTFESSVLLHMSFLLTQESRVETRERRVA